MKWIKVRMQRQKRRTSSGLPRYFFFLLCFCISIKAFSQLAEPIWKFDTYAPIYGSIATDGVNVYFGNEAGEFYSISKEGKENWMVQLKGSVKSTPSIVKEKVIINTSKGFVYALSTLNGKEIWNNKIGDEKRYDLWDYYFSSPVLEGNKLYLGLGDGSIHCIDADSGKKIWKFQTDDVIHASAIVSNTSVYVGGFDGFLYKLNRENGSLKWKFDTKGTENYPKGEIQKSVLLLDDKVYVTCRGNFLYEIDNNTGAELRNYFEPGSWIIATPTKVEDGLIFGTSDTQTIRKISLSNFKPEWSTSVTMRVYCKIAVKEDKLYLGTFDGKVIELSKSGNELSSFQSDVSKNNYSLIYGDNGYFRQDILALYGSNIPAAEKLLLSLGGFAADPVLDSGKLFFPSIDGSLYCFATDQ